MMVERIIVRVGIQRSTDQLVIFIPKRFRDLIHYGDHVEVVKVPELQADAIKPISTEEYFDGVGKQADLFLDKKATWEKYNAERVKRLNMMNKPEDE
jgi:hypothetical protein